MPCKDVVLHARASSTTEVNVKKLGDVPLTHSESGVHKVLEESGCSLRVPLSYVDIPTQKAMPYITMTSWIQCLFKTERLHYLTGAADGMERRKLCCEFWKRVQQTRPEHPSSLGPALGRFGWRTVSPFSITEMRGGAIVKHR